MVAPLRFEVDGADGRPGAVPVLGGHDLVDLVEGFETRHRYHPAGGYAGLVPGTWGVTDLVAYYLGTASPHGARIWVLGCDCGEAGCWPLEAAVAVTADTVTWSEFSQPHRPAWSYDGFGPFVFSRAAYETAVRDLTQRLGTTAS